MSVQMGLPPEMGEATARRKDVVSEFVTVFLVTFGVLVLGYGGIYAGLSKVGIGGSAFHGLAIDQSPFAQLLYFSIVTIATLGYGDIAPSSFLARLAVSSEVLCSFALIVLLVAVVSLTSQTDE